MVIGVAATACFAINRPIARLDTVLPLREGSFLLRPALIGGNTEAHFSVRARRPSFG